MRKITLLCISIITCFASQAQTQIDTSPIYQKEGKVGIGTTNPFNKLHIENGDLRITNDTGTGGDGMASIIFSEISNSVGAHARITYHGDDVGGDNNYIGFGLGENASKNFSQMVLKRSGNFGIGTISPKRKLHLQSGAHAQFIDPYALALIEGVDARLQIISSDDGSNGSSLSFTNLNSSWTLHQKTSSVNNRFDIGYRVSTQDENLAGIHDIKMSLLPNGNVGIGTTSPEHKLQVAGSIKATEIKVEAQTADFVFEDDYQLKSLEEVEQFVQENKHLPDIPSAKQMEEEGVGLAKMNKLLLQKVEELTLYVIEQQKEIVQLKAKEEKIDQLEVAIQTLMNQKNTLK